MPQPQPAPSFLEVARRLYGESFRHTRKRDVAHATEAWAELTEDDQSFTLAHLLYLNLEAQAAVLQRLGQVRGLLDELADSLTAALEASLPDEDDDAEDDGDAGEIAPFAAPDVLDHEPDAPQPPAGGAA